ncbi:hypothetical protein RRG08_021591 [Elysia crispata]|uniref:Uncharacterized protein n=1 Tax=Elysia crispata TaxID=231223 RepID=A0AAE0XDR0_9GAST|nr:hypothetical protein RRG08_021591 [Elysia crispata]
MVGFPVWDAINGNSVSFGMRAARSRMCALASVRQSLDGVSPTMMGSHLLSGHVHFHRPVVTFCNVGRFIVTEDAKFSLAPSGSTKLALGGVYSSAESTP